MASSNYSQAARSEKIHEFVNGCLRGLGEAWNLEPAIDVISELSLCIEPEGFSYITNLTDLAYQTMTDRQWI